VGAAAEQAVCLPRLSRTRVWQSGEKGLLRSVDAVMPSLEQ
jgi:hypothetical protein